MSSIEIKNLLDEDKFRQAIMILAEETEDTQNQLLLENRDLDKRVEKLEEQK